MAREDLSEGDFAARGNFIGDFGRDGVVGRVLAPVLRDEGLAFVALLDGVARCRREICIDSENYQ